MVASFRGTGNGGRRTAVHRERPAGRKSHATPRSVPLRAARSGDRTRRATDGHLGVLRAIANSPHDLQPIFDVILHSSTRLCRANIGTLRLFEEGGLDKVVHELRPLSTSDWLHLQRSSCDDPTPMQSSFHHCTVNTWRDIE